MPNRLCADYLGNLRNETIFGALTDHPSKSVDQQGIVHIIHFYTLAVTNTFYLIVWLILFI